MRKAQKEQQEQYERLEATYQAENKELRAYKGLASEMWRNARYAGREFHNRANHKQPFKWCKVYICQESRKPFVAYLSKWRKLYKWS